MIALEIYFTLLWVAWAYYNYKFISKKNFHNAGALCAALVIAGVILACMGFFIEISDWNTLLWVGLMSLTLRWVVFDLALNLFRKREWWYYGTILSQNRSWIDKTLGGWQIPIKIILLFWVVCMNLFYYGIYNFEY